MYLRVSTKETIIDDLEEIFDMDADFSGDNGQDNLLDIAKDAGYDSNAAYFANKAFNKFKNTLDLEKMFYEMYFLFMEVEGRYWDIDFDTLKHKDTLVVAMSARPKNQS